MIYRKHIQTNTAIHFTSNHPLEHKFAAYILCLDRIITLPITEQAKHREGNIFLTIARNNGFPLQIIHNQKNKLMLKK